jgi:hypothetical protein
MTPNGFRKLALQFPGAAEAEHMNHPDFRVNGKIFATLSYPDENWGMVKLTPEQQASFIKHDGAAFRPCKGVWGERGATNVHLKSVKKPLLEEALAAALKNATLAAKKR